MSASVSALAPVLVTVSLYWILLIPDTSPGPLALVIKCLPTISCALAIHQQRIETKRQSFIKYGLLFSTVGDAALVWPQGFLVGMLAFAVGHYFYIRSVWTRTFLGASPVFSVLLGLLVYGAALTIYNSLIRPGLGDPVLAVGVPVYIIWLSTTVWRSGVSQSWVMFMGSVLFMISDCIIGINMFYTKVDNSQFWIMSTYQLAQILIMLSAIKDTARK